MRNAPNLRIEKYRVQGPPNTNFGMFIIPVNGIGFRVIASEGSGWDHISVSLSKRTPTWEEMDHIKRLFFRDDEWAMQLHASVSDHINLHPHCLHIWRPQTTHELDCIREAWRKSGETMPEGYEELTAATPIPLPPKVFV